MGQIEIVIIDMIKDHIGEGMGDEEVHMMDQGMNVLANLIITKISFSLNMTAGELQILKGWISLVQVEGMETPTNVYIATRVDT